jgi:hypothetical protein
MNYAVEMGSGVMTYTPTSIKIGFGIQKLLGGIQTHAQQGDHISLHLLFQNKERRLKTFIFVMATPSFLSVSKTGCNT